MGVYKSDSWTKASVFNPLTGDVALMTTLIGGETFLAPQEEITQETTNGNYISQWRHRVQFACSDWDAFDTLQGFKDDHIAVQAVAAAEALNCANLQWYESVQIKELRKVPKPRRADGDSYFIVVLEYEGDENAAIFNNVNLMEGPAAAFSVYNSGLLDEYKFLFPIKGIKIITAGDYTDVAASTSLLLSELNFSETTLNSDLNARGSNGNLQSDLITTEGVYIIRIRFDNYDSDPTIANKVFRCDGSTAYRAG